MCRAAGNANLFAEPPPVPPDTPFLSVENGVGIVTIHGALMKRPDFLSRLLLDATDMEDIAAAPLA